jgi:diguanylate cyclase (GGDEF)-like protein
MGMLRNVSLAVRAELLFGAEERTLAAGEVLLRGGEPNETMYLLTEGQLEVHLTSIDDDPIAVIGAGETVGELSLLDGSVASASVVATTDCKVLAIGEAAFWDLVNGSHAFAVELLVKLAERLRANNSTVSKNVLRRRMYERAAMFDGLTGIHNRRWLDDTLHRLVTRHREHGGSLCVALIDIDHFKKFNDTYGHDAGDFVLAKVAGTLAANLRPTDLVARFGGEEFVIIFPETALEPAAMVANRVREAVADQAFAMPGERVLPQVTISVGVSQLEPEQTVPTLLKVADTAMYRAKRSGRNRVLTATNADLD